MIAVDTNVLIYAVDATEPVKSKRAEKLLQDLCAAGESIVVPWQVAAEFLACLRRWISAGPHQLDRCRNLSIPIHRPVAPCDAILNDSAVIPRSFATTFAVALGLAVAGCLHRSGSHSTLF